MRPHAIKLLRPDKVAIICAWCAGKDIADKWAESRGYELSHTICGPCKTHELGEQKKAPPVDNDEVARSMVDAITIWLDKNK